MIHFSVLLATYNRHKLLQKTLESLRYQTYKQITVYLIDNGSEPPISPEKFPSDLDIKFTRVNCNRRDSSVTNKIMNQIGGTHFVLLADDDVLLPKTLEIVSDYFLNYPDLEVLATGFSKYNHETCVSLSDRNYWESFSGDLHYFDGYQSGLKYCNSWGIGKYFDHPLPRMAHPTASFFSIELIKKTISRQKELFIKPIGDVGFVGCNFNSKYIHYLDLPLAVLGESKSKDNNGSIWGDRHAWKELAQYLEYSPLKGCSFINLGLESHLKVLYRHGLDKSVDLSIRPDIYLRHLSQILSDDPWSDETERDLREAIPITIDSIVEQEKISKKEAAQFLEQWIQKQREEFEAQKTGEIHQEQLPEEGLQEIVFPDIIEFAKWQEENVVMPKLKNNTGKTIKRSGNRGKSESKKQKVKNDSKKFALGVWGFYEEQYKNNWIFFTPNASIGDELLKPLNDLYRIAFHNDIEIKSLDMIENFEEMDAFLFFDFPKESNPLVKNAFTSGKPCYLNIVESPLIRPENWNKVNQSHFSKIFTYCDDIVDNKKYFKVNYASDFPKTIQKNPVNKKKLCTVIAGNKEVNHELSLYPHRKQAIKWFEQFHPDEFDLYGFGWDKNEFPSYKGTVKSKLNVLKEYKFSICYENVRDINGYITEKIIDCLKAGCIPVYWGAGNIADHIPKNCFIDKRNFSDYGSLYTYLKEMSDETYLNYLKNIESFFNSEKVIPFTTESFVKTILEVITNREIFFRAGSFKNSTSFFKMSGNEPQVTITIAHYNRLEDLRACLESVKRHTPEPYELIVMDNGSTDGVSKEYLRSLTNLTLIDVPENLGTEMAGAYLTALAKGKYIAALTNDIIVTPGWLSRFIAHAENNPQIGLFGPRSNFVSGPQVVPNVPYSTIKELDAFAEDWAKRYEGMMTPCDRLVGFCMFIRKAVFDKIGVNDNRYGFGFDDDDFTLRTLIAGFKTAIVHDVFIHHTGGPQMRGDAEYNKQLLQAWEHYKQKWGLPPDLKYGQPYNRKQLLKQKFDPKRHYVPLPDKSEVEKFVYKPAANATKTSRNKISIPQLLEHGEKLFEQQNFEDAKKIFKAIITVDPNHFRARNDLACVLWQSNQLEDAAEEFRKAMETAPNDRDIVWNSGQFLSSIGFINEAIDIYKTFLSRFPAEKEMAEAVEQWEKVAEKDLMAV